MKIYKSLVFAYLHVLLVYPFAAIFGVDLQGLIRDPILHIRYIDILIFASLLYIFINTILVSQISLFKRITKLQCLIILFICFDAYLLFSTYGVAPADLQLSWFLATSILMIIYDLSRKEIGFEIFDFIFIIVRVGALISIIVFFTQMFGLSEGFAEDVNGRVTLSVLGQKETISYNSLNPVLLVFGLIGLQLNKSLIDKILFILGIATVIGSLTISFHRGGLTQVIIIFLFFFFGGRSQRSVGLRILAGVFIVIFSLKVAKLFLESYGYDPVQELFKTIDFAFQYQEAGWSKGRAYVQTQILYLWSQKPWLGWGYDVTEKYVQGSSAHNFIITSLFHRGIVGTSFLIVIFCICYYQTIKLYKISNFFAADEKLLLRGMVLVVWLWIIPAITQEVLWERYTTSVQYFYFGIIFSLYNYCNKLVQNLLVSYPSSANLS